MANPAPKIIIYNFSYLIVSVRRPSHTCVSLSVSVSVSLYPCVHVSVCLSVSVCLGVWVSGCLGVDLWLQRRAVHTVLVTS